MALTKCAGCWPRRRGHEARNRHLLAPAGARRAPVEANVSEAETLIFIAGAMAWKLGEEWRPCVDALLQIATNLERGSRELERMFRVVGSYDEADTMRQAYDRRESFGVQRAPASRIAVWGPATEDPKLRDPFGAVGPAVAIERERWLRLLDADWSSTSDD